MPKTEIIEKFNLAFCLINSKKVKNPLIDFYTYLNKPQNDYAILIDYEFKASHIEHYITAINYLKTVLRFNSDHAPSFALMGIAKSHFTDLDISIEAGIYDLQVALEIDPNFAFADNYIGTSYIRLNNLIEAKEWFRKAFQKNPFYLEAKLNLALVNLKLKDLDRAMDDLNELIDNFPKFAPAYYHRAILKKSLDDIPGSFEDFDMYDELCQ